ncbi:major intrinsic protein domain-containing protein [Ditylenchus destructor]|uniref:Major intrinsic protein domain-containing protein n=1 Tax=Ditylenchus destructor TaxID=166010 RepID=A0AAD4NEM7_9BILA|nr:major intrinsic protein domain-containing protein [Ditylenchus destructor]
MAKLHEVSKTNGEIRMPKDFPNDRLAMLRQRYRIKSKLCRNVLCEFLCTTFLIYVTFCGTAQTVLSRFQMNNFVGHPISQGFGLIFAVQMGYQISGSHLNPAVSLFLYSFGEIQFINLILYTIAQTAGAFCGAALTFGIYYEKIHQFDGGRRAVMGENATAGIFATFPGSHLSILGAVWDQIWCTAIMCIIVGLITDKRNQIPKWVQPSLMGIMLITICMSFGLNAGNAMNPARDFAPRVFLLIAGYGPQVFSYHSYQWWWVPVICPPIGALLGAWLYKLLIGIQIPSNDEPLSRRKKSDFGTIHIYQINTSPTSDVNPKFPQ